MVDSDRSILARGVRIAVALGLLLGLDAAADSITVNGERWDDVLIYRSSTMYYVKVPADGSIFNVPLNDVDRATVRIERDPYYRDELKRQFDDVTSGKRRPTPKTVPGSEVFNVRVDRPEGELAEIAPPAEDPMAVVTNQLKAMGFTLSDDGGDKLATSADGGTTIRFKGGTLLGGVRFESTVAEAQVGQLNIALQMLGGMAGQAAPWVPGWLTSDVAPLLQSGGSAEKSQGPISIKADVAKAGGNITLTIDTTPAA